MERPVTLFAQEWNSDSGSPVVLIHGITASHLAWASVAALVPDRRLIAPDLRGRGASSDLPGPFGMRQHAADLIELLDEKGIGRAPLVGHSMGAFVALVTAYLYPDRVTSLLLIDGGLPLTLPPGRTPSDLLGPAAARLAMTFPDRSAYRSFWQNHPAFAHDWSAAVESYADYDLVGEEPALRSRTSADAVGTDSVELYGSEEVVASLAHLTHPATLLTAPRGLQDETPGLYPPSVLAKWAAELPQLKIDEVPNTNHYTIVMGARGAAAVAERIRNLGP